MQLVLLLSTFHPWILFLSLIFLDLAKPEFEVWWRSEQPKVCLGIDKGAGNFRSLILSIIHLCSKVQGESQRWLVSDDRY
jgi:hypothetical protein